MNSRMRGPAAGGVILLVCILVGGLVFLRSESHKDEKGLALLEQMAREQAETAAREYESYRPLNPARLADLDADAEALLRDLLGVQKVTRSGPKGRPVSRIVHVCDYHIVPPEQLGLAESSPAFLVVLA